jgi:hypothetical protein
MFRLDIEEKTFLRVYEISANSLTNLHLLTNIIISLKCKGVEKEEYALVHLTERVFVVERDLRNESAEGSFGAGWLNMYISRLSRSRSR